MGGWRSPFTPYASVASSSRRGCSAQIAARPSPQRQLVPSVIGLTLDSARRVLTSQKLVPPGRNEPDRADCSRAGRRHAANACGPPAGSGNRVIVVGVTIRDAERRRPEHHCSPEGFWLPRGIKTAYATEQVVGAVSGVIIRQDPAPGAVVNSSLTANLTGAIGIADQPPQRPVPNVVGRQVRRRLRSSDEVRLSPWSHQRRR